MLLEIEIPFPGFYESTLSSYINQQEEYQKDWLREEYDIPDELFDSLEISRDSQTECERTIAQKYAEEYVYLIYDFLDIDLELKDIAIESPKYYNYTTDRLFAKVEYDGTLKELCDKLRELAKPFESDLREYVAENFTSYDGFWSFMSNDYDEWDELIEEDSRYFDELLGYLTDKIVYKKATWSRCYDKNYFLKDALTEAVLNNAEICVELEAWKHEEEWEEFQEQMKVIDAKREHFRNYPAIPGLE